MGLLSRSYVPLYSAKQKHGQWRYSSTFGSLRYPRMKISVVVICLLFFLSLFHSIELVHKLTVYYTASFVHSPPDEVRPPVYTDLRSWEMSLPQHNPDLPFPEGRSGRYVLFSNSRINLSGWNNKLNDMLLNTWLAHSSNRAYVFHDFAWVDSHYPWPISSYRQRIPRTPVNALLSGPSAGGPWEEGDTAPRSVSEAYFDIICPKHERKIINTRDVKPALRDADGKIIFHHWKSLLAETRERCIEVVPAPREEDQFPETFDIFYWSSPRSMSLWDEFVRSPVSRLLNTSPIVHSAIRDNIQLFASSPFQPRSTSNERDSAPDDPFLSVFSIHVRRGDFRQACLEHAAINSTFYNWNLLPFLPDRFQSHTGSQENEKHILKRCWPTSDAIRERVNLARKMYEQSISTSGFANVNESNQRRSLDVLYIMSNDRTEWIDELRHAFVEDGWSQIVMSRDLKMNPQQKDVGVAVDMEIGRRSAVFVGNGWSSFTSNVVHRRLADGKTPISIRFW